MPIEMSVHHDILALWDVCPCVRFKHPNSAVASSGAFTKTLHGARIVRRTGVNASHLEEPCQTMINGDTNHFLF